MNIDQRRHVICNGSVCEGRFAYVCAYEVVLLVRRTRPATLFSWKCLNLLPNGAGPPSPQLEQVPGGAHDRRAFLLFEEPWRRGTGQTTTMSSSSFSSETQVCSQTRGAAAGARVARDRTSPWWKTLPWGGRRQTWAFCFAARIRRTAACDARTPLLTFYSRSNPSRRRQELFAA